MNQRRVRLGLATVGAAASVVASAGLVAAEASFVPGMPGSEAESSSSSLVLPLALLLVGLLAVFVLRRSTSTRVGADYLLVIGAFVIGVISLLAGFFGDLSGQRRIFVVPIVIGVVFIAGSMVALWRIRRDARRSTVPSEPSQG